jgi:hypothetical protein
MAGCLPALADAPLNHRSEDAPAWRMPDAQGEAFGEPRYFGDRMWAESAPRKSNSLTTWWKKLWAKIKAAISGEDDHPDVPPVVPPVTPPADDPPPAVQGDNTFLWKPVSETRQGRAVVLLPANVDATKITVNGEAPAEYAGRRNGNRQHYFLRKTGAAYGANVDVIAVGTSRRWKMSGEKSGLTPRETLPSPSGGETRTTAPWSSVVAIHCQAWL